MQALLPPTRYGPSKISKLYSWSQGPAQCTEIRDVAWVGEDSCYHFFLSNMFFIENRSALQFVNIFIYFSLIEAKNEVKNK